jgi:hypothetical protein
LLFNYGFLFTIRKQQLLTCSPQIEPFVQTMCNVQVQKCVSSALKLVFVISFLNLQTVDLRSSEVPSIQNLQVKQER